jgi:hypothetical protein
MRAPLFERALPEASRWMSDRKAAQTLFSFLKSKGVRVDDMGNNELVIDFGRADIGARVSVTGEDAGMPESVLGEGKYASWDLMDAETGSVYATVDDFDLIAVVRRYYAQQGVKIVVVGDRKLSRAQRAARRRS